MVRPVAAFIVVFALLSLIVHQIGMFELFAAAASLTLLVDVMIGRLSKSPRTPNTLRDPLL
ncbi:MAG TPA: hypothetical protein VFA67_05505 [Candidatus Sulfotelmatobacter sp.]|nr:hypothetical protein [Candidatus Sulfotelmatobacter sp.]